MERRLEVDPVSGLVSGLRIVGINGCLHVRQTPSLREPIFKTDDGRPARIIPKSHRDGHVEVKVAAGKELFGGFTLLRSKSWPVYLNCNNHKIVVVGECEICNAESIARFAKLQNVKDFLLSLPNIRERFSENYDVQCEIEEGKLRTHVLWYVPAEEADDLFNAIRIVACQQLIHSVMDGGAASKDISWWLGRAAGGTDLLYLAVAGLARAQLRYKTDVARELLRGGLWSRSEAERERGLAIAEAILEALGAKAK